MTDSRFPTKAAARRFWKHRKFILDRDPVCVGCNARPSEEADHVLALSLGGTDTVDNMQGLCKQCHRIKSRADKRKAYRARRRREIRKVGMDGFPARD